MEKQPSRKSPTSISSLVWKEISSSVVVYAFTIFAVFLSSYLFITAVQKNKALDEKTVLMKRTLNLSLSSGDWTLALDHLLTSVNDGGLSEVSLSASDGELLAGPLRSSKLSLFPFCKSSTLDDNNNIDFRACIPLISKIEIVTITVILLIAVLAIYLLNNLFTKSARKIILHLSSHIASMRYAIDGNTDRFSIKRDLDFIETTEIVGEIERLANEARKTQADRTRSELVAQIVHDIRGPLTALNVIKRHPVINSDVDIYNLLSSASEKIENLSSELLRQYRGTIAADVSKSSVACKIDLKIVLDAISIAIEEKKSDEQLSNIKFETSIQIVDGSAHINALTIQRILDNLITNAVQAITGKNGVISIIGEYDSKSHFYTLRISDNGSGIDADDLPLIFSRGFTKNKANGTGLGLHFVKTAIESIGGAVTVRSQIGQGTQFEVKIPVLAERQGNLHASL